MAKKRIKRIVVHCSDSEWGTALTIAQWHIARGFRTIGYHAVVCNSYPTHAWWKNENPVPYYEGSVEIGRPIDDDQELNGAEVGAHVAGFNQNSFGVCMIGKNKFSNAVLDKTLEVVRFHLNQFGLQPSQETVKGHYELNSGKTCPNIDMVIFRGHLIDGTNYISVSKQEEVLDTVSEQQKPEPQRNILYKIFNRIFN